MCAEKPHLIMMMPSRMHSCVIDPMFCNAPRFLLANSIGQLQNVTKIMSDAQISQQDLYLLCVDCSSAFNAIDHDKLLCIMHDLGLPENAIEVIAAPYTNAIIKIKLYFADIGPIKMEGGTIQGDTLSLILLLIFIEPLLAAIRRQRLQVWLPEEELAC